MIKASSLAVAGLLATTFAFPAVAEVVVSVPLQLGAQGDITTVQYSCADGTELPVQYVNAKGNSLALLPLKGKDVIFVNVVSASGARYVAGTREWWSKGGEATLKDELAGADPLACSAKSKSED